MKLIFFSDIHGNKYSFQAFLRQIADLNYDKVIFCGDVFGYYYYAEDIIQEIMARQFHCLLGNHDDMLLKAATGKYRAAQLDELVQRYGSVYRNVNKYISQGSLAFLASLKSSYEFVQEGIKIGIFHGTPDDPLNGRLYPDTEIISPDVYARYNYVILGHTHHKMVRRSGDTIILNPGSLGQQRDGKGCSYLILDTISGEYQFNIVNYDINALVNDIKLYDNTNERLIEVLWRSRS